MSAKLSFKDNNSILGPIIVFFSLEFRFVKEKIGLQIRNIRMSKGYSQKAMALELDMKPNAYSKIDRGEVEISASRLQQIATFLKVPVADFFSENKSETKLHEPKKEYGFATKGDLEETVRMIQNLVKEVNQLKAELQALVENVPKKKISKK